MPIIRTQPLYLRIAEEVQYNGPQSPEELAHRLGFALSFIRSAFLQGIEHGTLESTNDGRIMVST